MQLNFPLPGVPTVLILHISGGVGFARQNMGDVIDLNEDAIYFTNSLAETIKVPYNTLIPDWKENEQLVSWLQSFNLQMPKMNSMFN